MKLRRWWSAMTGRTRYEALLGRLESIERKVTLPAFEVDEGTRERMLTIRQTRDHCIKLLVKAHDPMEIANLQGRVTILTEILEIPDREALEKADAETAKLRAEEEQREDDERRNRREYGRGWHPNGRR